LFNYDQHSKVGDYLALIYTNDGDPMGSISGTNLDKLMNHLQEATEETNCNYILLEIIDSFRSKTLH